MSTSIRLPDHQLLKLTTTLREPHYVKFRYWKNPILTCCRPWYDLALPSSELRIHLASQFLMILYLIIVSVNKKTLDYAWNLMGIAVRLAQSVSQMPFDHVLVCIC
jgi:hypothetical protein